MMEKVLLIDDDRYVRDSLALALETAGYDVADAANVQEGLSHHRSSPASVVITDVVTVEQCGWEPIRALRRQSPDIPIIAISGTVLASDEDTVEFDQTLGPVCTLQKPFTVDEFLSTVKTVLPSRTSNTMDKDALRDQEELDFSLV